MNSAISPADLPLQRAYRWERERAEAVFLTQPVGAGAVIDITWARAMSEARHLADFLQAQNWPAGSRVAILGKNSAHWVLADLAIWMAGHVSVPVYPSFSADNLRYILTHSGALACFVGKLDSTSKMLLGVPSTVPLIPLPLCPTGLPELSADYALTMPLNPNTLLQNNSWDAIIAAGKPMKASPVRLGSDVATIIYTSGTTGRPKGVVHSFDSMAWGLHNVLRRAPVTHQDRFISYLPLAHVAERMLIEQASIREACHIYFVDTQDSFLQDMRRARPTVFFSVPRLWVRFQRGVHQRIPPARLQRLLRIPLIGGLVARRVLHGLGLDQCRLAAGGAAAMPAALLQWYRRLGLPLIEVYGLTENGGVSHATQPSQVCPGAVGLPCAGVEQRIAADTGEIQIRSPALMLGYYKDPELTATTLTADGWLSTGDKGHLDAEGLLHITGRLKDVFKTSKGRYIAPSPIEDLLVMHPSIEACAVTGANLDQPLAIVMLSAPARAQAASPQGRAELQTSLLAHRNRVNAQLNGFERLSCLVLADTDWTPESNLVTPTLKVKRIQIDDSYGHQFAAWAAQGQPVVWMQTGEPAAAASLLPV